LEQFMVIVGPQQVGFGFPAFPIPLVGNRRFVNPLNEKAGIADPLPIAVPVVSVTVISPAQTRLVTGRGYPVTPAAGHDPRFCVRVGIPDFITPYTRPTAPEEVPGTFQRHELIAGVQKSRGFLVVLKYFVNADPTVRCNIEGFITG